MGFLNVGIELVIRNLKTHDEAYEYLRKVRKAMASLLFGGSRFYCTNMQSLGYEDGQWFYGGTWVIPFVYLPGEEFDEDED